MSHNTLKAAMQLRQRLELYPWFVSVQASSIGDEEKVTVHTHVHVPSGCRWLIPETYLGVPVVHRKIGSPSPGGP
jgi:hypothetical protein